MSVNNTPVTQARSRRKPKKSQIPVALLLTISIILFGFYLSTIGSKLPSYWIFGLAFGYILQRSRFCFTTACRDPSLTGSTSVTRAVLIGIALSTIGITAVKYQSFLAGGETNLNMTNVNFIGIPLILGATIFGVGMVIAGGCASGTLMRVGEGFTMQIIALAAFVFGTLVGAHNMSFWGKLNEGMPKIFLPDVFGWFGALVVQFVLIAIAYIVSLKWQNRKSGNP